jgi:hypothetical protein
VDIMPLGGDGKHVSGRNAPRAIVWDRHA